MIYVTGDTHGDVERFKTKAAKRLRKGDTLIVCGDFGFVWNDSKAEQKLLKWLGKRRYHILFLEGTHDNLDLLAHYPTEEWKGGAVRRISGNLMQLLRGEVFTIESDVIFAMGGGESTDVDTRIEGVSWWQEEMPTEQEMATAKEHLEKVGNVVDYVVTHEASATMRNFLDMNETRISPLGAFFTQIEQTCRFKKWFFGSAHKDKLIPPRYVAVFQEILPLK